MPPILAPRSDVPCEAMSPDQPLIDQALAAVHTAASEPNRPVFGGAIPITPEQALVWSVYLSVKTNLRGRGDSIADVERYKRVARSAGIPEPEIDAAVTAAERDVASEQR